MPGSPPFRAGGKCLTRRGWRTISSTSPRSSKTGRTLSAAAAGQTPTTSAAWPSSSKKRVDLFFVLDIMEDYKSGKGVAMKKEELFARIEKAIIEGRKSEAEDLAREAVKAKLDLTEVIEKGYVPGIQKVGDLWEKGDYFLPELITSAECMKAAMAVFQPELDKAKIQTRSRGKIVIGTVEGDIHDIGKNLVASMLSANGFDVVDLGADVQLEKFIEKAEETKADFICLSALLTTTMLGQKKAIELLKQKNLCGKFKVLVGGAPANQKWADEVGGGGYAENAMLAVKLAARLKGGG